MNSMLHEVSTPFLQLENLCRTHSSRRFPWQPANARTIFSNLSLTLRRDETVGLVGVSGCGKSTLLNTLLALSAADSGQIYCEGKSVVPGSVRSLRWYRRKVQVVMQDPAASLAPGQTVAALLAEPLRCLGIEANIAKSIADVMEQVALSPQLLTRTAATLSGGQAQRVAIARALIVRPAFLLADEPVSGLDLPLRAQIKTLLQQITRENRMGLLMVSHDISMINGLCERILVMSEGGFVEQGPTAKVLSSPQHSHTRDLLQAIPAVDFY